MNKVILRPIQQADLDDLCRYSTDPEAAGEFEWTGFNDPRAMRRRWEEDGRLGAEHGRLAVMSADSLAGDVSYKDRSPGGPRGPSMRSGLLCSPSIAAGGWGPPPNVCSFSTCSTPCRRTGSRRTPRSRTSPSSVRWRKPASSVRESCGEPSSELGSGATTSSTPYSETDGQAVGALLATLQLNREPTPSQCGVCGASPARICRSRAASFCASDRTGEGRPQRAISSGSERHRRERVCDGVTVQSGRDRRGTGRQPRRGRHRIATRRGCWSGRSRP
jgi:hypothetical protein